MTSFSPRETAQLLRDLKAWGSKSWDRDQGRNGSFAPNSWYAEVLEQAAKLLDGTHAAKLAAMRARMANARRNRWTCAYPECRWPANHVVHRCQWDFDVYRGHIEARSCHRFRPGKPKGVPTLAVSSW